MKKCFQVVSFIFIIYTFSQCKKNKITESSPTLGQITILCDNNLEDIIKQEENIFERQYPYAHVDLNFNHEFNIFKSFITDSIEVIIASRFLNEKELSYLDQQGIHPKQYHFATSAIAFITNLQNVDSTLNFEEAVKLFSSKPQSDLPYQSIIIEDANSGIVLEILNRSGINSLPSHFFTLPSKNEVISYVKSHPNTMGIIDWSAISDSDNPIAQKNLNDIRLLHLSRPKDSIQFGYIAPYQYNLQDHKYPFTRDLVFISRTGKSDLGLGFASFITSDIGQKIILKAGLLPKFQTERLIEFKQESYKVVK